MVSLKALAVFHAMSGESSHIWIIAGFNSGGLRRCTCQRASFSPCMWPMHPGAGASAFHTRREADNMIKRLRRIDAKIRRECGVKVDPFRFRVIRIDGDS